MTNSFLRTGLHLALLVCALSASAQHSAAPQRIEISAVRQDVRTLCPTIDNDLQARLARSLHMLPKQALVDVQFQIDGQRIADVAASGDSFDTHALTRRAVRSLDCNNGGAGRQTVRFQVHYKLDDMPAAADRNAALAVGVTQSGQVAAAK